MSFISDLKNMDLVASPAPWRYCNCGHCGLVWSLPSDFCILSVDADSEDEGMTSTQERKDRDAALLIYLRNRSDLIRNVMDKLEKYKDSIIEAGIDPSACPSTTVALFEAFDALNTWKDESVKVKEKK